MNILKGLAGIVLILSLAVGMPEEAAAAGSSPFDPIPFNLGGGSMPITGSGSAAVWLRIAFAPTSAASHVDLETLGSVDTTIHVFASLPEALQDTPIAEDDDSGPGLNALLRVPLGFLSPYLVRVTGNGSFQLRGQLSFVPSDRCDWPAGCPLALAAEGEPGASDVLKILRDIRSELLLRSRRGRDLIDLYWRLGGDLIPDLLVDGSFRERAYEEVTDLLPLARTALESARGRDGGTAFTRDHLDRLHGLLDLVAARVSPDLAAELRGQWDNFALVDKVGLPLSETLSEAGLLAVENLPRTVIVKLRFEPTADTEAGQPRLRTGDARLDAHLTASGAKAVRPVHADSPARRAAGLTRTIAFEVGSFAKARTLEAELEADPSVEWAEVGTTLQALATDPFRNDLWGLDAVRAPQAWASTSGSCTTPVAIVDTGLRTGLADLEGRILHHLGYDFADGDPDPQDGHGHGTHVAGTIAAALNNSTSIAGVAPGACVFGVKVLSDEGEGTSEAVAAGIVHATDAGARVINLSLGCDCDVQQVIEDALAYAATRDVVIVAAAGNDGVNHLHYPASSPWTIAVAALDRNLALASFSSYGPGLDLAAPGVDVVSLFRDGESCMGSGTSMAAPHVAGVAALMRSRNPTLNREQVRSLLRDKARDLGAPGYDTKFGAGLVDAAAAVAAAGGGSGVCTSTSTALCLSNERFRVETFWRRPDGATGQGQAVRLTPDTGYFWFFDSANLEAFVKVLNACGAGSRFWVFAGGMTNVEVRVRVTDTATNQIKEYLNPLGTAFQPIQDTNAFATCSAAAASGRSRRDQAAPARRTMDEEIAPLLSQLPVQPGSLANCTETATSMCLSGGRFRVEASWRLPSGEAGSGRVVRLTPDTGYFWFFNSANVEMFVKVLNACGLGSRFWVFGGGLTNVEVRLRVTDTVTNQVREYVNPAGVAFKPIQDTNAFTTCL
jgi:cell wall-associated protease